MTPNEKHRENRQGQSSADHKGQQRPHFAPKGQSDDWQYAQVALDRSFASGWRMIISKFCRPHPKTAGAETKRPRSVFACTKFARAKPPQVGCGISAPAEQGTQPAGAQPVIILGCLDITATMWEVAIVSETSIAGSIENRCEGG